MVSQEHSSRWRYVGTAWGNLLHVIGLVCMAVLFFWVASKLRNVMFWLALTAGLNTSVFALANVARLLVSGAGRAVSFRAFQNLALVLTAVMVVVVCAEAFFAWREQGGSERDDLSSAGLPSQGKHVIGRLGEIDIPLLPEAAASVARIAEIPYRTAAASKARTMDRPTARLATMRSPRRPVTRVLTRTSAAGVSRNATCTSRNSRSACCNARNRIHQNSRTLLTDRPAS